MNKTFLLKALVSVSLLLFLLSRVDFQYLWQLVTSTRLSYVALALVSYVLSQIVSCFRWVLLARPLGFALPMKQYLSYYFIGMFFSLFAPSTVGGDVSRVFYLARGGNTVRDKPWGKLTTHALASVVADRVVGLAALVWIGGAALIAFPRYSLPPLIYYLTGAMSAGFLVLWLLLPLFSRLLQRTNYSAGEHLRLSLETYRRNQGIILQTIVLSLVVHAIQSAIQVILGFALDLHLPWSYAFILYPLVGVFSALPISFNGIGLREGGYVFLLGHLGVSSEKALAFGLLWFFMVALDSLIGGLVFVLTKTARPSAESLNVRPHLED
jgi:uncharacterized protein (TIRG00374 family)